VNIEPLERISESILAKYNKNPNRWSVLADHRGNLLVLGPEVSFRLKLVPLSPDRHIGVGVEISRPKGILRVVEGTASYGFRPLSRDEGARLLEAIRQGDLERGLVRRLLGISPVSTREIQEMKPEMVVGGPVILHPDLSTT